MERFADDPWAKSRASVDLVLTGKQDFLRLKLHGHFEVDFRYLGDDFDDPTREAYQTQLLPREVLVGFSLGPVELTIGRQIVAWGEGDALSPLDVVNPRDLREPGLADLDDIRMSVFATRIGLFLGDHRIEAMVIHEADFGLRSPPFGPFSPFPALIGSFDSPIPIGDLLAEKQLGFSDREDRFALGNQQPLLRWVYKGPGVDLGAYAAWVLDRQGTVRLPDAALLLDPEVTRIDVELAHPRYGVIGTSGAWASGSTLLKWELGASLEKSFNVGDSAAFPPTLGIEKATTIDAMLALNYTPITDLQLALEITRSTFVNKPKNLLFPADDLFAAFRLMVRTLRERLTLSFAASAFAPPDESFADGFGFFLRAGADYELMDGLKLGLAFVHYNPSDDLGMLSGLDTHDNLSLKLRYDFTLL